MPIQNIYHMWGVDRESVEFNGNKQTNKLTYWQTHIHTLNFIYQ